MSATIIPPPPPKRSAARTRKAPAKLYAGTRMDAGAYLHWKPDDRDGWKYEWNKGVLETYERTMQPKERGIVKKLLRLFATTKAYGEGGELLPETDVWLPGKERFRRPDLAYFSSAQIEASKADPSVVPLFVIELISAHDSILHHETKMREYFEAGVQCLWHVFPDFSSIRVYTSPQHAEGYDNGDTCTAAPALPDFKVKVSEIFA